MTQLKVLTITTGKGLKCGGGGGDLLKINKCCQTLQIKDKGDFFFPLSCPYVSPGSMICKVRLLPHGKKRKSRMGLILCDSRAGDGQCRGKGCI